MFSTAEYFMENSSSKTSKIDSAIDQLESNILTLKNGGYILELLVKIYGAEERIMNTPTDILLSLARFKIDPTKSGDINMTLGIKLNDTNEGYKLQIRQAVLEFQNTYPNQYDITINTDESTLKQVIAGLITLDDALNLAR
jgi:alkyl sulfatase BDS1-like metallo-beta-lactamase superfamily hydrolase